MTTSRDSLYAGYRYPAELIAYAVWLYFRFPLSLRMVEEMLAARGISVTYETIRQWGLKFGRAFANRIRRRAPRRGNKWHLDEVVITIAGTKHWLWRAVDQEGYVPPGSMTVRPHAKVAGHFDGYKFRREKVSDWSAAWSSGA
jgi:putative transposase